MDGLPPVQNENRVFLPLPPSFFFGCSYVCVCALSPLTPTLAESAEMELTSPLVR